jgi:hypothetical protein
MSSKTARSSKTSKSTAPVAAPPAPAVEEPVLDLELLQDAADAEEGAAAASHVEKQVLMKLTPFIDALKAEYPEATRFNIYFFSDRAQRIKNEWSDSAAYINFKPCLIMISFAEGKPKLLDNSGFNTKYDTTNWGLQMNESEARKLKLDSVVNILKVLPAPQDYQGTKYYRSRIMKPEQKIAASIEKQLHETWPQFVYVPKEEAPTTDDGEDADISCCY